jgi:phage terminase small subunit
VSETQDNFETPKKRLGRPPLDPEERERRSKLRMQKYKYSTRNPAPRTKENKKLTAKQERFIRELVTQDGHITLTEAAINAGYSPITAPSEGSKLMNPSINPHVVRKYLEYKKEMEDKYAINYKRHIRDLQVIRDKAMENGSWSAAVQAEYRRGQAHGDIYINKSEIRHGSIDQMSKEEVLKALEELRGGRTEHDITPTEEAYVDRIRTLDGIQETGEEVRFDDPYDED